MQDLKYYTTNRVHLPRRADFERYTILSGQYRDTVVASNLFRHDLTDHLPDQFKTISFDEDFESPKIKKALAAQHIEIVKYFLEDEFRAQQKAYQEETTKLNDEFKRDLIADNDVTDNPKSELCFKLAWDRGHASGLSSVVSEFEDLVELIK